MAKKHKVSDTKLTTRMLLTYNSWRYCNCCGAKVIEIVNEMQEEAK